MPLLKSMDTIVVGDAGRRAKVIALFKKHGITSLPDGRRIEDVVFARYA